MILIDYIELINFKGISSLKCDFLDFTTLAGLNNSGKTSVLQAVCLLVASLPHIVKHKDPFNSDAQNRQINTADLFPIVGIKDVSWLYGNMSNELPVSVTGSFLGAITIRIEIIPKSSLYTFFTIICDDESLKTKLANKLGPIRAELLTSPGDVPATERMLPYPQYLSELQQGNSSQHWRNSIWWAINTDQQESYERIKDRIKSHFPDIQLLLPTLGRSNPPEILINFCESGSKFDIAQSGTGLRSFIALSKAIDQSPANIILLDEPDSHLHASQQAAIINLLLDSGTLEKKQIIISTHSPELLLRSPAESIKWVDRRNPTADGGFDTSELLSRLGVHSATGLSASRVPDILVYVEGETDRPVIENLITWYRRRREGLPSTIVVSHKDGRFEGTTLQGIHRVASALRSGVKVVGIRDLDWYYHEMPDTSPHPEEGNGWKLLTLPCKEIENLFCNAKFVSDVIGSNLSFEVVQNMLNSLSSEDDLINEWKYQVVPRIRDRMPKHLDNSTRERQADTIFKSWIQDADARSRLVAGKLLLSKLKQKLKRECGKTFHPPTAMLALAELPPLFIAIINSIFEFDSSA
jgi:ABC-type transport system involved in cytochrome c biogenesis ATPase subunit